MLAGGQVDNLRPVAALVSRGLRMKSLPEEAVRLACRLFAGHSGMSRDELLRFFAMRGVNVVPIPDGDGGSRSPSAWNSSTRAVVS